VKLSHLEYLLFSALSYCYFDERDCFINLADLFYYSDNSEINKKRILLTNKMFKTMNYYSIWETLENNIIDILKSWEVVDVLDRTDYGKEHIKTGFYGIAFGKKYDNNKLNKILISFRGSQLFPFKEAYRDFIETDLKIGLGKKPTQFDEGLEFYKRIINKFDYKSVELTGHSLGGGIAQYVAVMSETLIQDDYFVPNTCTFNSIGIAVQGMIKVEDFLELNEVKNFICDLTNENKWESIKPNLIFYLKKKLNFIESSTKLLPIPSDFDIKNIKIHDIEKLAFLSQLKLMKNLNLTEENYEQLITLLFSKENLEKDLYKAIKILEAFHENTKYSNNIFNFAHSSDFTATYFPHIGKTIYIDKYLEEKSKINKKDFFKTLNIFQTMIKQYHLFDVFIPFISRKRGKNIEFSENDFSGQLNICYLSSALRRLIYKEKCSKELLIFYYKRKLILKEKEIYFLKNIIIKDFEKSKDMFIYKNHIVKRLKEISNEDFLSMWYDSADRLVSPFEYLDIFDYINFVYEETIL